VAFGRHFLWDHRDARNCQAGKTAKDYVFTFTRRDITAAAHASLDPAGRFVVLDPIPGDFKSSPERTEGVRLIELEQVQFLDVPVDREPLRAGAHKGEKPPPLHWFFRLRRKGDTLALDQIDPAKLDKDANKHPREPRFVKASREELRKVLAEHARDESAWCKDPARVFKKVKPGEPRADTAP
jgi:hypothetical protein